MEVSSILGIVPARGGSKGIPKKNIKSLNGYPLIYYSIKAATDSLLDFIIVSTDDVEIAKVSQSFNCHVVERPSSLAKDDTPMLPVVFHAIEESEKFFKKKIDTIVLLQPTSPLRTSLDIKNALSLYKNNDCECVVGVTSPSHPPYWMFIKKGEFLSPLFSDELLKARRQDLPQMFIPNGSIFIISASNLKKYQSFYTTKTLPYYMPPERSIDIDSILDFEIAELIMKNTQIKW